MKMKHLLAGLAALPLLAGVALAGQPAPLSDTQMDGVTAGLVLPYTVGSLNNGVCGLGGVNCGSRAVTVTLSFPVSDGAVGLASFGRITSSPLSVIECSGGGTGC